MINTRSTNALIVSCAGWLDCTRLADCGLGYATAAAGTADVADAGDPWVVRRVDAKLF